MFDIQSDEMFEQLEERMIENQASDDALLKRLREIKIELEKEPENYFDISKIAQIFMNVKDEDKTGNIKRICVWALIRGTSVQEIHLLVNENKKREMKQILRLYGIKDKEYCSSLTLRKIMLAFPLHQLFYWRSYWRHKTPFSFVSTPNSPWWSGCPGVLACLPKYLLSDAEDHVTEFMNDLSRQTGRIRINYDSIETIPTYEYYTIDKMTESTMNSEFLPRDELEPLLQALGVIELVEDEESTQKYKLVTESECRPFAEEDLVKVREGFKTVNGFYFGLVSKK